MTTGEPTLIQRRHSVEAGGAPGAGSVRFGAVAVDRGATMDDGVMVREAGGTVPGVCDMRIVVRVLGGFTATVGDDAVNLGGPRQCGVLARVLIGESEAVSAEQVLHDVWGERAAEATVGAVHAYVSRLR